VSVVAFILLLQPGHLSAQEAVERRVVEDLNRLRARLAEGESSGDVAALDGLYADDVVFQTPETAPVVGSEALLALWSFVFGRATLDAEYTSRSLRVFADEAEDAGTVVYSIAPADGSAGATESLHYELRYRRAGYRHWVIESALYSDEPDPGLRFPGLPTPTGPFAIGSVDLIYVDSSRADLLSADGEFRRVSAQVWYPASRPTEAVPVRYRTPEMVRAAAAFLGWPAFFNTFLTLVDTHSFQDASPSSGAPFPVVVYHHGYGGFTRVHVALIEELASHGYVVASVGHAYESAYLQGPDTVVPFDPENAAYVARLAEAHGQEQEALKDAIVSAATIEEQVSAYRDLLEASPLHQESTRLWAADGSFILDRLAEINGADGVLGGSMDLSRVGAIGHSLGGAASGQSVVDDDRVVAGVDMDGFMFGDYVGDNSDAAFLYMSAARSWAGVGGSALTAHFERAAGPAYLLVIDGFEHGSFTDLPLFASAWPGEGTGTNGARAIDIQRVYVRSFFDRHLKDVASPALQGDSPTYPEVRIRTRNTLGPS